MSRCNIGCNIIATDKTITIFYESINGSAGSHSVGEKDKTVPKINQWTNKWFISPKYVICCIYYKHIYSVYIYSNMYIIYLYIMYILYILTGIYKHL